MLMKTLRPGRPELRRRRSSGELCDEMQIASEELGKRERIQGESCGELRGLKPARCEVLLPLAEALVVISQRDAVRAVAHPVHGAQGCVVEGILTQVIFQDDVGARDARGFTEELRHVGGVVEHVDEEANVKRSIGKGKLRAIERAAWDLASWPGNHLHAFNGEIGPAVGQKAGDCAVAATDIEHAASFGRN